MTNVTEISNPGYPTYKNNMNCVWILRTDPTSRINFQVDRYNWYGLESQFYLQNMIWISVLILKALLLVVMTAWRSRMASEVNLSGIAQWSCVKETKQFSSNHQAHIWGSDLSQMALWQDKGLGPEHIQVITLIIKKMCIFCWKMQNPPREKQGSCNNYD